MKLTNRVWCYIRPQEDEPLVSVSWCREAHMTDGHILDIMRGMTSTYPFRSTFPSAPCPSAVQHEPYQWSYQALCLLVGFGQWKFSRRSGYFFLGSHPLQLLEMAGSLDLKPLYLKEYCLTQLSPCSANIFLLLSLSGLGEVRALPALLDPGPCTVSVSLPSPLFNSATFVNSSFENWSSLKQPALSILFPVGTLIDVPLQMSRFDLL